MSNKDLLVATEGALKATNEALNRLMLVPSCEESQSQREEFIFLCSYATKLENELSNMQNPYSFR